VFDAFEHYPSYEFDKTLSESPYGRFKIRIENSLLKLPPSKYVIARLPMVFGNNAPRTREIENLVASKQPLEVFPNTIVNVTSDRKLSQQIHYIINQKLTGIFHLGSIDLITHFDFIKRIISRRKLEGAIFKQIFTSNQMRYLAVLPKENKLPSHLNVSYESILEDLFLL
jgi:dTDP-4-dehydrorhamnose reductase